MKYEVKMKGIKMNKITKFADILSKENLGKLEKFKTLSSKTKVKFPPLVKILEPGIFFDLHQ